MTETDQRSGFARNAFHQTMVGLDYSVGSDQADIFSRACVEAFAESPWTRYGYPYTQVFETSVLQEISVLEPIAYDDLALLRHRPTAAMRRLGDAVDNQADLSLVERLNLASVLVSIARLDLAETVMAEAAPLAAGDRDRFELAWLRFVISNRQDDGRDSASAFSTMRAAIEAGGVPASRALDACTQAVVWYLKRKDVSEDDFVWSVRAGDALATQLKRQDFSAVSSWYRGLAMLPAAKGMADKTRSYMEMAWSAAEEAVGQRRQAYKLNLVKTYHESTLKEHMYVTKDFDAAVEAGRALIDLDPVWSVSYGELAEAHVRFGRPLEAAQLYDQAVAVGPPYVGHHLLKSASCWEKAGDLERALGGYERLASLVPGDTDVLTLGLRCARELSHPAARSFETALALAAR
jgi:tetratricopeptide (TPR) repeat protein